MRANKRVEAVLRSPRPNWGTLSSSDISSCILSKIERFKGLHRIPKPTASVSQAANAIVDDLKTLYPALARKRDMAEINKKILDLERKQKELATANPFDSIYLEALKSERVRLSRRRAKLPAPPPSRSLRIPTRRKHVAKKLPGSATAPPPERPFAKVSQLHDVFSTEFDDAHTHFVKSPIEPGIQPCLIELRQLDGTVKLTDALTVLPASVSCSEIVDPVYAAYLNLIGHEYESDIEEAKNRPDIQALRSKTCSEPPFSCPAQSQIRQLIFAKTEKLGFRNKRQSNTLSLQVRQAFDELVATATKPCFWHPRHLVIGQTRLKWQKAWAILARWDEWELQKPPRWDARLVQFFADRQEPVDEKSQRKGALRKMCDSLDKLVGLKKGDLSALQRLRHGPLPKRTIVL